MKPARGVLIVKPIETEETLPGGLIVLTENARKDWAQWQMEVVAVGLPAICEKPKRCERPHHWSRMTDPQGWIIGPADLGDANHLTDPRLVPGAWVIVKPRATVPVSPDSDESIVRVDDVVAVLAET